MPRKPRLFVPGATYHVYCRVARGEFVFSEAEYSEVFIETLLDVRDRDDLSILAWCLMSNHYHVVMKTSSVPLWRSMARLQGKTAREHNRRRGVLGRLWQSRYRARLIDSNEYFMQVVAYVHLNPVAAGLVADPADYRLSGHREVIGHRPAFLLDAKDLLELFGTPDPAEMRAEYLSWLRVVAEERWFHRGLAELPWWRDAENGEEIANPHRRGGVETYDQRAHEAERLQLDLDDLLERFEQVTGVTAADLGSAKRGPELPNWRVDLTAIVVGKYGHRVCDVAKALKKNPGTVSRWLTTADRKLLQELPYRSHLDDLDRRIQCLKTPKVIK